MWVGWYRAGSPDCEECQQRRIIMLCQRRNIMLRRLPAAPLRRGLCGTAAHSHGLPKWGAFGKSAAQIEELEDRLRRDGERQVQVTKEMASLGIRLQAMITQPFKYFNDSEWRAGWLEAAEEPLLRFSRINEKLLDGCEQAYKAIATEFHADKPDFEQFVQSEAIEPGLAALLERTLSDYASIGRKPTLEMGRVNGQVLLMDTQSEAGFIATVVFRTRELRSSAALPESTSHASAASVSAEAVGPDDTVTERDPIAAAVAATEAEMEAAAATDSSIGGGDSRGSNKASAAESTSASSGAAGSDRTSESDKAESVSQPGPGDAAAEGETEFEDFVQLWTFTAEQPPLTPYLTWLRAAVQADAVGPHEQARSEDSGWSSEEWPDTGVRWKLRDINFVMHDYVPPEGPTDPVEYRNEVMMRTAVAAALALVLSYTLIKVLTTARRPRPRQDDGGYSQGGARRLGGSDALPSPRLGLTGTGTGTGVGTGGGEPRAVHSTNQWGDQVAPDA